MNLFKYELFTYFPDPDNKFIGIDIIVRPNLKILFKILSYILENNIDIHNYIHSDLSGDKTYLFIICNFSESKVSPEELIKSIKKLFKDDIINIEYSSKILDSWHASKLFPYVLNNRRSILLGRSNLEAIIFEVRNRMNDELGSALLYHIGVAVGRRLFERLKKVYGEKLNELNNLIELMRLTFETHGWGRVREYKVGDKLISVYIDNLWECEIQLNKTSYGSHYVRGILKGIFEEYGFKDITINEDKCITRGDEFCSFIIRYK